jgi:hypothetical protein
MTMSTWHPMQNGHMTLVLTTLYWILINCTISIPYEKFHSCNFKKNYMWMRFFIQTSVIIFTKKNCWKFTFIWKRKRIMLEAFVSKSISHVYQNIRWNFLKLTPNNTKCTKKKFIFLHKWLPHSVLSP